MDSRVPTATEFHKIAVFTSNLEVGLILGCWVWFPCRWIGSLNIGLTFHLTWQKS